MRSRTPEAAEGEPAWSAPGLWLLGMRTAAAVVSRGGDPLSWSAAPARRRVRRAMRGAIAGRRSPLARELAGAVRDGYARKGGENARKWPPKKRGRPPGAPDIRPAARQEVRAAQRVRQKQQAVP